MANILFQGYLYDDAGAAIANATVNLYDRNTTTPVRATTTTGTDGLWTISHATQGRFDIEIVTGTSKRRRKYDDQIQVDVLEVSSLRIRNPGETFEYDIVPAAIAAARQLNLPLITATDTLAVLALAQTFLTGVKTFNDNILALRNPADTYSYNIRTAAITAARDLNLPLITATDTLVSLGLAQTFTAAKTFGSALLVANDVQFPATQVASSDANALDDYEEGTWTPTITFGGAAVGLTYAAQTGTYTKIGNRVFLNCNITLSAKGSSTGQAAIASLPFTVGAVAAVSLSAISAITFADYPSGIASAGTTTIIFYEATNAGTRTTITEGDFANTSDLFAAAAYNV